MVYPCAISMLWWFLFKALCRYVDAAAEAERRQRDEPPFPVAFNPFDAIACAIQLVNPHGPPRDQDELRQLVPQWNTTQFWVELANELGLSSNGVVVAVPFRQGCRVAHLAAIVHPDVHMERWTGDRIAAVWRSAQIFAVVRMTMVEALGVEPAEVTRSARLVQELGA